MSADPLRPDLTGFRRRLAELEGLLADPATFADNRRAAALGAELRFTSKAVKADDVLAGLEKHRKCVFGQVRIIARTAQAFANCLLAQKAQIVQAIGMLRLHMRAHLALDIGRLGICCGLRRMHEQPVVQSLFRMLNGWPHGPQGVIQIKGYGLDF